MENPSSKPADWDWELIPNNSPTKSASPSPSSPDEVDSVIRSDYFSLESDPNYSATSANDAASTVATLEGSSGGGGDSDNPSWVDPSSSSVVSVRRRMSSSDSDSSDRNLMDFIQPHTDCCAGFECQNQGFTDHFMKSSEYDQTSVVDDVEVNSGEGELGIDGPFKAENDVNAKKMFVWWKFPVEVLKYCVMRVNPVWSLPMAAAALMGIVILRGRYLYKMKCKSLGIQLNVATDDKKVSQFSRVARLNEAFKVVKRVPIIRPVLPAPGMASWQVMSLR